MGFIETLTEAYQQHSDPVNAEQMKAYMKNNFEFYGIKAGLRRELMKTAAKEHILEIRDTIRTLAFDLYDLPQRELHMCAMELFEKHLRNSHKKEDIHLIEKLITTNSWWDSVDFIAKNILGQYLRLHPEEIKTVIHRFSSSDNMWLQRSSIIFQLGYKEKTDKDLLFKQCLLHCESKEFFIQKAIGWALREYGSYNPKAVLEFATTSNLKPLSKREAIRKLI